MAGTKRSRQELEAPSPRAQTQDAPVLQRLRGMWEFANLAQFLFLFGKALKIEHDLGIEELERQCLTPGGSPVLLDIGLILLKLISTQRGLNAALFDEYMKKEYRKRLVRELESKQARRVKNAILGHNPFGDEDEEPKSFKSFDVFEQIQILQQLTQWVLTKPELLRDKMNEPESEQLYWRVESFGWDSQDREHFLLDDNRLYRRGDLVAKTGPPPPVWKPKANTKKAKAAARASRRLERLAAENSGLDQASQISTEDEPPAKKARQDDMEWECIAVTLHEYEEVLEGLKKSRDPNEKALRERINEEIMPIIMRAEEEQQRKAAKREKEVMNLERLAGAKRSSRVAARQEREKEEEEAAQAAREREIEAVKARKEAAALRKREEERNSRLFSRGQRAKERETRRLEREEELAKLESEGGEGDNQNGENHARVSERHRKAREYSLRREIEELNTEDWYFDCSVCGIHGRNQDDGTAIIACDECNIWQHVACLGLEAQAASDDFEFTCDICLQKIEDEKEAASKPPLKLVIKRPGGQSSSPPDFKASKSKELLNGSIQTPNGHGQYSSTPSLSPTRKPTTNGLPNGMSKATHLHHTAARNTLLDGPNLSPQGQLPGTITLQGNADHSAEMLNQSFEQSRPTPSKAPSPPLMTNGATSSHNINAPPSSFAAQHSLTKPKANGIYYSTQKDVYGVNPTVSSHVTTPGQPQQRKARTLTDAPLFSHELEDNNLFTTTNNSSSNDGIDKEHQSPRVNLPPSSSPSAAAANGMAGAIIPPSSAGLSPTKHHQ